MFCALKLQSNKMFPLSDAKLLLFLVSGKNPVTTRDRALTKEIEIAGPDHVPMTATSTMRRIRVAATNIGVWIITNEVKTLGDSEAGLHSRSCALHL